VRKEIVLSGVVCLLGFCVGAGAEEKPAGAALARLIHQAVVAKVPRQYEDLADWGKTIPPPDKVRFPRLKRTYIQVGDHYEVPHGTWKRTRIDIEDPARDIRIEVPEVRKTGKGTTRLRVEATVSLRGERERKEWAKGVSLLGITVQADVVVTVALDVDVTVSVNAARPLDGLTVEAKVDRASLGLKDFQLRRVGPVVILDQGPLGDELKKVLEGLLKSHEPQVKEYANKVIAKALADGKVLPALAGGLGTPRAANPTSQRPAP
jgi:hypothetical protein